MICFAAYFAKIILIFPDFSKKRPYLCNVNKKQSNKLKTTTTMKETEIQYAGYNVIVKEDSENYYIDFRTGLGEGIYPKSDWTLDKALEDQANI